VGVIGSYSVSPTRMKLCNCYFMRIKLQQNQMNSETAVNTGVGHRIKLHRHVMRPMLDKCKINSTLFSITML